MFNPGVHMMQHKQHTSAKPVGITINCNNVTYNIIGNLTLKKEKNGFTNENTERRGN